MTGASSAAEAQAAPTWKDRLPGATRSRCRRYLDRDVGHSRDHRAEPELLPLLGPHRSSRNTQMMGAVAVAVAEAEAVAVAV